MVQDKREDFHLFVMKDFLPVGMAIFDRAKKGGLKDILEAFNAESDVLQSLKSEGEESASSIREKLDKWSPGLGNPVTAVDVTIEDRNYETEDSDTESLMMVLDQIEGRLDKLSQYLENDGNDSPNAEQVDL